MKVVSIQKNQPILVVLENGEIISFQIQRTGAEGGACRVEVQAPNHARIITGVPAKKPTHAVLALRAPQPAN